MEKVHVPDLVVLNHIPHEGRVVDAAEICHGRLPSAAEVPQTRKASKGKVVLEKLLVRRRRPFRGGEVETTQCPILGEGERLNVNLDVPAGEVSGEVPGEHPGVGPCEVDIAVPIHPQRIDDSLPARNLLYLVEEEVGTRSAVRRLSSEVVEQLLGSADGQADGGLEVEPDRLGSWMVLADLLSDKVEDGGLSAAAHSGEDLDDRGVGVWRDAVGVARARNNLVGLGHGILPSTTIDKVGLIAILIDHSRQTSHLFTAPSRRVAVSSRRTRASSTPPTPFAEIGPLPARDRSYSAPRSVHFRLEIGRARAGVRKSFHDRSCETRCWRSVRAPWPVMYLRESNSDTMLV